MKVLLVKPVASKRISLNIVPPIGLGYLATALRKNNINVDILDCVKKELDFSKFANLVKKMQPDIIGLQVFSQDLSSVKKSLMLVRKINPNIFTIVGGPHPSGMPKETLTYLKEADFAFQGEAEIGLVMLVQRLSSIKRRKDVFDSWIDGLKEIPGLIWRKKETVVCNSPIFAIDLDNFGYPAWDLIDPREYPQAPQGIIFKQWPVAQIMATRGCPFRCVFCAGHTISGRMMRYRSIKNVLGEIKLLYDKFGVKEIQLVDDNFSMNKEYVKKFCLKIIESNLKINWCCPNGLRLDTLDEETLLLMKESGCYYVSVGIESGSPRILRHMKKGLTIEKIKKKISLVKKMGLNVNGFFIIGYPEEEEIDILRTIKLAKELQLSRAAFYNFLPLPGSEIYDTLDKKGELDRIDWDKIFQAFVPYCPPRISKKKLKYLQRRAYLEFYLRPKILCQLIREIKTINQLKFIIRRFSTFLLSRKY